MYWIARCARWPASRRRLRSTRYEYRRTDRLARAFLDLLRNLHRVATERAHGYRALARSAAGTAARFDLAHLADVPLRLHATMDLGALRCGEAAPLSGAPWYRGIRFIATLCVAGRSPAARARELWRPQRPLCRNGCGGLTVADTTNGADAMTFLLSVPLEVTVELGSVSFRWQTS